MNYDRFAEACREKGTTPTELTLKLGLSKGNASSWKKNGNPSVDILIKISGELETSIDYLLGRTDTPYLLEEKECEPKLKLIENENKSVIDRIINELKAKKYTQVDLAEF